MEQSLVAAAVQVLNTSDTTEKANLTRLIYDQWVKGELQTVRSDTKQENEIPPLEPARPDHITLVEPKFAPKRGKGGLMLRFFQTIRIER